MGASGNVGTSLLRVARRRACRGFGRSGLPAGCRRRPSRRPSGARRTSRGSPLRPLFQGADAVVHLAWLIQPARDQQLVHEVNVDGSARVFTAAAAAGVRHARVRLLGRRLRARPEGSRASTRAGRRRASRARSTRATRPRSSACSTASRHEHPDTRVVRLRPGLIFKREAASGIRRLFAGPLLPDLARPAAPDPGGARTSTARVPGRALARRRRGLPAGDRARRGARAPSTSPPTRCSTPTSSAARSARGRCAVPARACCAPRQPRSSYACSPPTSRAGSTWRSAVPRDGHDAGARASSAGAEAQLDRGAARPARGHARGRRPGDAAARSRAAPARCGRASS